MQKPEVVSKARVPDVLDLIAAHVGTFNAATWRGERLPAGSRIYVDTPTDGHGAAVRLRHGETEICIRLRPGVRVVTNETTLTPPLLRQIRAEQVAKITTRRVQRAAA